MKNALILVALMLPSLALADTGTTDAAPAPVIQSYDVVTTRDFKVADGTTHPAGTCIGHVLWDGVTPYARDGLEFIPDPDQSTACYVQTPPLLPTTKP